MLFTEQAKPKTRWAFPLSLAGHALFFTFAVAIPSLRFPHATETPSEFAQKFEGHEDKIVYYKFRKELPEVRPVAAKAEPSRPPIAEHKTAQQMVSAPPKAPKTLQTIFTPAPITR
ncbi:MAG: hypothetical protein KGN84_16125 [Acidobacteriota bacterium]|nr:hypothetical protein [Acidobacteriota bacterium]